MYQMACNSVKSHCTGLYTAMDLRARWSTKLCLGGNTKICREIEGVPKQFGTVYSPFFA